MNRFFGMMPCNEIKRESKYRLENGGVVIIQAGPNGWSVLFPDQSSEFKDTTATTRENYKEALEVAKKHYPELKEASFFDEHDLIKN